MLMGICVNPTHASERLQVDQYREKQIQLQKGTTPVSDIKTKHNSQRTWTVPKSSLATSVYCDGKYP